MTSLGKATEPRCTMADVGRAMLYQHNLLNAGAGDVAGGGMYQTRH